VDENTGTIRAEAVDYTNLAAELVSAYVAHNNVPASELPALIARTHAALAALGGAGAPAAAAVEKQSPAQIRKSITHEALISFEDGKPYKTLKRHLTVLGLTPETYREKWGLPHDYPMVAASYSERRSAFAKGFGLGQHRRKTAPEAGAVAETVAEKPKRAGRPRKAQESDDA
jgi:predicted transcriptional regulator